MKLWRVLSFSFGLAFSLGCTKGVVNFAVFDQDSIPQPLFAGQTSTNVQITLPTQTTSISGQCDPKISAIVAMAGGAAATFDKLETIATSSVTVDCAGAGTFSFTLKALNALGFTITDNTTYDVKLKAVTDGGISNESHILIRYATTFHDRVLITSGATLSNVNAARMAASLPGGTFQAQIRVHHMMNDVTATSSHYKMKIGVAADKD